MAAAARSAAAAARPSAGWSVHRVGWAAAPRGRGRRGRREPAWRAIAAQLALDARAHYRALIYENPDFPAYFRAATPIDVIERLRIGSRPGHTDAPLDDPGGR